MPPEKRQGSLWDAYRSLHNAGYVVDARDYTTAFRVKGFPQNTHLSVLQVCRGRNTTTPALTRVIPGCVMTSSNRVHV